MSVGSRILRSCAIAAGTLAVGGLLDLLYIVAFCPRAHLARHVQAHEQVVVDAGYRYAVAGESIFTCTTTHRLGPWAVHGDFGCYCAPADVTPEALAFRFGGGICTVDKPLPSRADEGICRHGHCENAPRDPAAVGSGAH